MHFSLVNVRHDYWYFSENIQVKSWDLVIKTLTSCYRARSYEQELRLENNKIKYNTVVTSCIQCSEMFSAL